MPVLLNRKQIFFFFIGIFILLFINSVAFADGLVPCTGANCNMDSVFVLINNIMNIVFPIINSIAFCLIVWGAILMITSQGSAEKFKKGREVILAVAIGFLLIYGAKFIVISFLGGLGGNTEWFKSIIK
ncbi:MAG: hypothetical protein PHG24_01965 [Candidatus Pacebacteria bacterium]|nr:hypothetical protein [Candidatus Paceibacterota bacterium]